MTISDFGVENGEKKTSKPLNFSCLRKKSFLKKIAKIKTLDSPLWLHHKIESFSWKLLKQASFLL